ncbi:hypothetical protein K413DRAFT_3120 [Clostridium sp. ASBs410]|nr:hypothetical protein K413DRAFT_3120 [Clostridium sp. ASBs410]
MIWQQLTVDADVMEDVVIMDAASILSGLSLSCASVAAAAASVAVAVAVTVAEAVAVMMVDAVG